jgi:hypothetical protein
MKLVLLNLLVCFNPAYSLASSLAAEGVEDFQGTDERANWSFYSYHAGAEDRWTVEGGVMKALTWGWNTQSAILYSPSGWVAPSVGWFEAKVRFENQQQEGGIIVRAAGSQGGAFDNNVTGVFFTIDGRNGNVYLRGSSENYSFNSVFWGDTQGAIVGYSNQNTYYLRLNFNGNSYYGQVFNADHTQVLYTSPTLTWTALGTGVGLYMGRGSDSDATDVACDYFDDLQLHETKTSLKDNGLEDFEGVNERTDWNFYSHSAGAEDRWTAESGVMKALTWGWNTQSAILYSPSGWTAPPNGWFEAKVRLENQQQEAGIIARAAGSYGGAFDNNVTGVFFTIDGRNGNVYLRGSNENYSFNSVFWGDTQGAIAGYSNQNTYYIRLNVNGNSYYGEVYNSDHSQLLFTTSTVSWPTTGTQVGLYMGRGSDSDPTNGAYDYFDDLQLYESKVSLKDNGQEDFEGANERADWSFYSHLAGAEDKWSVEGGMMRALTWGWNTQSAILYSPSGWSAPGNGWFEAKVKLSNSQQEAGIIARAEGFVGGTTDNNVTGVFFLINGNNGQVILRGADANYSFASPFWDPNGAGSLSGFSNDTWYYLRINFFDDSYYGEIYNADHSQLLFTTPAYSWSANGTKVGLYMARGSDNDPTNVNYDYFDDLKLTEVVLTPMPTFTPNAGSFGSAQSVSIACAMSGATIRYTTNGSEPTESSQVYSSPIVISETTTLKAKAWAEGYSPSITKTGVFALVTNQAQIPQRNISIDGSFNDWPTTSEWSRPFVFWNGVALTSTTRAKFAWNDAQDLLYIAVETNETGEQPGGHLVIGAAKNKDSVPASGIGSTQLCFTTIAGSNEVYVQNEMALYGDRTQGADEVIAAYSYNNTTHCYTYEIALPLWTDWHIGKMTNKQNLEVGQPVYVYIVMQDTLKSLNGMNLSYYGNPHFNEGAFDEAAVLTLVAGSTQLPGDANNDGSVDVGDLGILAANYGGIGKNWGQGDFNGDGAVDVGDLGILAAHYGEGSTQSANFSADYAKVFGNSVLDDSEDDAMADSSACGALGLPLIAGLMLASLMICGIKIRE